MHDTEHIIVPRAILAHPRIELRNGRGAADGESTAYMASYGAKDAVTYAVCALKTEQLHRRRNCANAAVRVPRRILRRQARRGEFGLDHSVKVGAITREHV